jgi:hypothetical protein
MEAKKSYITKNLHLRGADKLDKFKGVDLIEKVTLFTNFPDISSENDFELL